jgi:hypothetical protein
MILLDELTCPVCGVEHFDHIIDSEAEFYDVLWEESICDACDLWAWVIEAGHSRDDRLRTFENDASFFRGRSS